MPTYPLQAIGPQRPSLQGIAKQQHCDTEQQGNADALPDLFTAFQDQLGLKLAATKASATVLVIDKVSKPSEN